MKVQSDRLTLETISPELAARIVNGTQVDTDAWHPEYPLEDELDPLRTLSTNPAPDPVFTLYLVRRTSDGLAIGGLGFFGPPDDAGHVEIGYGLVPSARGQGFATEAVRAALDIARRHQVTAVDADTRTDNLPSQRVLEKAGFTTTRQDDGLIYYTCPL